MLAGLAVSLIAVAVVAGQPAPVRAAPVQQTCPADLTSWKTVLGAEWIDCHQLTDLTTTGNGYTDTNSLTGMGFPPPGSGSLNSNKSNATSPAVSGLQIDGYFHDSCNAYQVETALVNYKTSATFIPGCTPTTTGTCASNCHHDAQFVIRIPDAWDGHLLTAGTPGIRDAFASDFILSDYAMEKGWAYVSQDKGNMGANFYQDGCDEIGASCGSSPAWPGACATPAAASQWCPGYAIAEWTYRMRQATFATRALLNSLTTSYGHGVTYSFASGISNGGYQTRRALETDTPSDPFGVLYDGGVDWEGTLFVPSLPAGVHLDQPTTGWILFNYLPTTLANSPADECLATCPAGAVSALSAVGFNPESFPLWAYHYGIYWGLTQKVYRLEYDPEYTHYTCSDTTGVQPPGCISPAAEAVPSSDADATYNFAAREAALPALAARIATAANTGNIHHPLITLHGDQDSLLPIKTDSDLFAQMVQLQGHDSAFRYYTVRGGNHVDGQFDDHSGVDAYGNTLLRPILPCARSALDAMTGWVEQGAAPPTSHTIPRDPNASAAALANTCDLRAGLLSADIPEGPSVGLMSTALVVIAVIGLGSTRAARRRKTRP
jgi:alpha/beta hydrolase family protein